MTSKRWFTADELKGLPGLPKAASSVSRKATKEGWEKRQKSGVKGITYEYHLSSLPLATKTTILNGIFEERRDPTEEEVEIEKQTTQKPTPDYPEEFDFKQEFALIPGYRIQVSAGHGVINGDQEPPCRFLAFRRKWLKYKRFNESELTVVWAKGDSMHPTISDNDTLIVHLGRKEPKDGHIYVFRNGEELFVKRYQSALGVWRLISDNSLYPPLDILKEEQHQFDVIGQVVHVAKDIAD